MMTIGKRHNDISAMAGATYLRSTSFKYSRRSAYSGLMCRVSAEMIMNKIDVMLSTMK